ncbi:hypothetical protein EDF83_1462 [Pseudomonas protegens]|uniref:DUF2786 domain-containing protein n=1 Tax=Pseudomonas TaxID=286 RepID=UPI000F4855F0|nr:MULTISPECIES: DUF2786 domain-containing protein [Pseudomonas]MCS4260246.1 hypothetical protein [Pseudomonas sp. BIGb0176]ROQ62182.1 hypothetical protein EDF83_1462 [Pseudomonas protegens]ROQ84502.1 hypothetical protein EC837_1380 [Pseudomonas protegens]
MQAHHPKGASGDISPKVQDKLRKLLALAERGEGGEKINARRMLDKMLSRHGLTPDDLVDEHREIRWFPATSFDRRLALQILAKLHNTSDPGVYKSKQRPRQVGVKVTPAEAIEFELHYDTLRKALSEHFKDAFSAFVQANRLFPADSSTDSEPSLSERDFRVMSMASAIPLTQVRPRLAHTQSNTQQEAQ